MNEMHVDEIIRKVKLDELVEKRNNAIEKAEAFMKASEQIQQIMSCVGHHFHMTRREFGDLSYYSEKSYNEVRQKLVAEIDRGFWKYVLNISGLFDYMDGEKIREFYHKLDNEHHEFNYRDVVSLLDSLNKEKDRAFRECLRKATASLNSKANLNNPYLTGKIVVNQLFVSGYQGHLSLSIFKREHLNFLEKAFYVLDEKPIPSYGDCVDAVLCELVNSKTKEHDFPYFNIKWFKNGNAHITFHRTDLVSEINQLVAE